MTSPDGRAAPRSRPPQAVLVALCALALAPPLLSYAGGTGVGAFRMFTRPFEQRITVTAVAADGAEARVPLVELEPHFSRDDRRVLRPDPEWAPGETAASLLDARGAADLGRLVCSLDPRSDHVRVRVDRRSLPEHRPLPSVRAEVTCPP